MDNYNESIEFLEKCEEMTKVQERFVDICNYAYDNTKWYRKDEYKISDNKTFNEQYSNIPCITKEILRENFFDLIDYKCSGDVFTVCTTGSTGKPTKTIWSNSEYNKATLAVWKARRKFGANFNYNVVYFLGVKDEEKELITTIGKKQYQIQRYFNEKNTKLMVDFINSLDGVVVYVSPSTMCHFIDSLRKYKIDIPKVDCIELNGEMVYENEKKLIEETFNITPMINYGGRECWPIAITCECGNLHVINDLCYVGQSSEGEIEVTSFVKKHQPLIKYKIGDLGEVRWGKCKCGKTSQIITNLIGRKNDFIYLKNGEKEHWARLSREITNYLSELNFEKIKEYSVHQFKNYNIEIEIVVDNSYKDEIGQKLIEICSKVYPDIKFSIKIVNDILQNERGKRIYLKSDFT